MLNIIAPYLKDWGYEASSSYDECWETYPILVIDYCNYFGNYCNVCSSAINNYNRKLVYDVNEFLSMTAALKGFTYIKKGTMRINGIEIKPGMVLETERAKYVVFPTDTAYAEGYVFTNINSGGWSTGIPNNIIAIYNPPCGGPICSGKILWEKSKEVVLTMDQIAKKFGIPVEQLKIQK